MVIASCLGLLEKRSVCSENIQSKKEKKDFVTDVDVKNKMTFCRSSYPDVFCKKGSLKYLAILQENTCTGAFFLKKYQMQASNFI